MPISFMSCMRGSGSKNASMPGITTNFFWCSPPPVWPKPPPPWVTSIPAAPGAATFPNVGFGM